MNLSFFAEKTTSRKRALKPSSAIATVDNPHKKARLDGEKN